MSQHVRERLIAANAQEEALEISEAHLTGKGVAEAQCMAAGAHEPGVRMGIQDKIAGKDPRRVLPSWKREVSATPFGVGGLCDVTPWLPRDALRFPFAVESHSFGVEGPTRGDPVGSKAKAQRL